MKRVRRVNMHEQRTRNEEMITNETSLKKNALFVSKFRIGCSIFKLWKRRFFTFCLLFTSSVMFNIEKDFGNVCVTIIYVDSS